ncbi:MAG TPA: S41 family peptidase [Candidatus Fimicola cottocaccae]|nr:S41 family peptidase [Candidatus Fimicola cottocaccae]
MKKRPFLKGLILGIALTVVVGIGGNFAVSALGIGMYKDMGLSEKISTIATILDQKYVDEIDFDKMEEGIYDGMVRALGDPYTDYMTAKEFSQFLEDNEGEFYGIGVEVIADTTDGSIRVISPIIGTPAERAGILPDDRIIKVNDTDVSAESIDEAIKLIKGEEGTSVKVTIYRQSTGEIKDFDIVREKINVQTVESKIVDDNIGYLRITSFKENTYDQFKEHYDNLMGQNIKGLVIDVRNNPGGNLDVVEKITDMLIPEGTLVYTIDKEGNREDYTSDAECINIPLCVLVNGNSASASEILSGAVQDTGTGKLVGTQTFGKGLVQGLYPLSDGSGLKITIQKYYTPKGVCIQGEGIAPDYVVELPEELQYQLTIEEDKDTQLQKALEVIEEQLK